MGIPECREFFEQAFAEVDREEAECLANLAYAQLQVEEMRDKIPEIAACMARPPGAANAAALRELLAAARARGVEPDPAKLQEFAAILAEGGCIVWPPRSAA